MKRQNYDGTVERGKLIAIGALYLISIAIAFLGAFLLIYSLANHIHYSVLHTQVHGALFGAVITLLGIRYYRSVQQLRTEVYKPTSRFSWNNFRKHK